ncbi:hypothetical protein TGAMA5MH_00991 [Trichoderma gamsii]|uniref:Zn(2)-C6 fungal-type domain-containing protein n=1 Tax=Trichoderma gamsii TaxID=398673 RepID=A0A2K0TQZ1_9HYPO|nr:hypothetical protein TGAMA5MH_00991 [Trichoderma gamsii]
METAVVVRSPSIPSSPASGRRQKRRKTSNDSVASNDTTSAAFTWPYGVSSATHGAQSSIQLYPYDASYMLSSSTNSAGVTETTRVPVVAPAGQLSLNGLPPDPQVYNAYQPQPYVGNTNGGPCPPYSLGSDNRLYYGDSTMLIQGHPSPEALNAFPSQHFHATSQPDSFNIARPRSQQQYIFQGVPSFGPTNSDLFQQNPHTPVYTAPQETTPLTQQAQDTNLPYPAHFNNPVMGGGPYDPHDSRQIAMNEYQSQAPGAISPPFTGFGDMLDGAIQTQNWLPMMSPNHEPRQHGRAEPAHHHYISDDLEELDNTDTDADAHGSSPEAIVEPVPSLKRTRSQLASGPPSRRTILGSSNQNEVKKVKACVRCRMQKMKCEPDSTGLLGDCVGCRNYSKTSKKTIHRMPCYRGKITDAVLYRSGGLQLTNRWRGTDMKDVGDRVSPRSFRTISFTLGISKHPIIVKVTEFRPRVGDVLARFWTVPGGEHGVRKRKDLAPFCLADIHKTAAYYKEYIENHAVETMKRERAGGERAPRNMVETTYKAAIEHYEDLTSKPFLTLSEEKERDFLKVLFHFWFAMRHSTGSSWICGEDTLEMKPEMRDESYPLFGKVSVPRMILAQFDSINTHLLHKYGKKVLSELEGFMSRGSTTMWYTVYLCLFILLREASWLSEDRYRHARNNFGSSLRYSIPEFVEQLQDGCNNLLHHWHYYNTDGWTETIGHPDRHKTSLAYLNSCQHALVLDAYDDAQTQRQLGTWQMYKENNGSVEAPAPKVIEGRSYQGRQSRYDWDHSHYWIAQLFEGNWGPHPTYQTEPLSPY